jgi:hypothetical protein
LIGLKRRKRKIRSDENKKQRQRRKVERKITRKHLKKIKNQLRRRNLNLFQVNRPI